MDTNPNAAHPETKPAGKTASKAEHGSGGQGGFTALFIRRPIFALVCNALMVVAGLAAYYGIEVRELPDVDRPVITVRTTFDGASPQTIDQQVTNVIEGGVARVSGLKSISSTSSFGSSRVTLEFSDATDLNVAASDVRDAISRVTRDLPDDADEPRIVKADSNSDPVMRLAVTSDRLNLDDLTQLVDDEISDRLASVDGVADVDLYGDQEKIFRVDIDQSALASRGLTAASLATALANIAFDVPAGSITSSTQDLVVRATAELRTPADFENLLIADHVRLGDVATVTFGPDLFSTSLRSNGTSGIGLGIIRQAQSNTLSISNGITDMVAQLQKELPEGTKLTITSDDAVFIRGSIEEVVRALIIAAVIVIGVIYLFLRDFKATIIPAITMPVSLIGTLAAVYLVGFSINILTLLAIVLATGLVVDDAIVVLENIVRRRGQGLGPRAAAIIGTQEVFFAVVATTATLAAVFIPLSFLPGQVGGLFREFGFVLAIAVSLSSIVALTLCPMLASRLLTAHAVEDHRGPIAAFGRGFSAVYRFCLRSCLNAPLVVVAVSAVFMLAAVLVFSQITNELTPREDRSSVFLRVSAPQGVSLAYLRDQMRRVEEAVQPLRDDGEIRNLYSISGFGGNTNRGFMVVTLAPWGDRERTQDQIVQDINKLASNVPGVNAYAGQANSLGIRGGGSGLQFALVGTSHEKLTEAAVKLIGAMEQDSTFDGPRLSNDISQAQLGVSIDRERAADLGIDISGLAQALQSLLDGRSIGDVFVDGDSYSVKLASTTRPIDDPTDLENLFLRTADGKTVPMSTIATLKEEAVAPSLSREQQLAAVQITAGLGDNVTLGAALDRAEALAGPFLPPGSRVMPLSEAATLSENSNSMGLTFGFAIVIIFLVLAAQFESVWSSLIIMATVPLGLACAVFALLLTGTSLNVYSQIGLVMLVGIMAKNGILIVEFANQLRDRGQSVREAIENAATLRLRPVMMTMIATILGGVPLVLAEGAGAEARIALGWVIVGGLGFATIVTLLVTPVAYLALARFSQPHANEEARLTREMQAAAALEAGE
ncbi:efflux RND transporter permease subunit [Rhizobium halophytocola]|uniref:HAE1 family hydrophobic/amphiphilic exporter-1 n=1 Tax=Rhizobium halophytocola TaxID=735519 RepID=A0ABS4E6E3_9HYPH|nr:efflux RND transporter permease subunit [Rhizobium halophytocola]MBP1853525.1 HAE1 family hydrophobic/amphiphilic exporter-1 [Rhizobium halophytocola]